MFITHFLKCIMVNFNDASELETDCFLLTSMLICFISYILRIDIILDYPKRLRTFCTTLRIK